jgi:hypothetical protein
MTFNREAIETAKMIRRMDRAGLKFNIHYRGAYSYSVISWDAGGDTCEHSRKTFDTHYACIKDIYFRHLLRIEFEDIELDIDDEQLLDLCIMADEQKITVDEVVTNLLKNYIDRQEKSRCTNSDTYNCKYCNIRDCIER